MELGDPPVELCAPTRRGGDRAERTHTAPRFEISQRPHRNLLQTDDPWLIRGHELDHLLEIAAPLRRRGVAVEEIPRANESRHTAYPTVGCGSSWQILRRSRRRTTTSLRPRLRAPVSTSSP